MRQLLNRTWYVVLLAVSAYAVALRCTGLGRSLWLDEAWVGNSVIAPSLKDVFYYPPWLQSSPPLFLLLERLIVTMCGLSNVTLRILPLTAGILALAAMYLVVRWMLPMRSAVFACTLLGLNPTSVSYSKMLKQYSCELFVTTAVLLVCLRYLKKETVGRFWCLGAVLILGILAAYAAAFLVPGIILVVWIGNGKGLRWHRAILLAAIIGAALVGEYYVFAAPNSPEIVRLAWTKFPQSLPRLAAREVVGWLEDKPLNPRLQCSILLFTGAGILVLTGLVLAFLKFRQGVALWLQVQFLCLVPCALVVIADLMGRYPLTDRTALFCLPCVILMLVSTLELAIAFFVSKREGFAEVLMFVVVLVTVISSRPSVYAQFAEPKEDAESAVSFLKASIRSPDFLWVHASAEEAFRLYAKMFGWDAPVHYGNTGWPCCPRGIADFQQTSSEALVRKDFGEALPKTLGGVWLLYTGRHEHWILLSDEPRFMRDILTGRGCRLVAGPSFKDMTVDHFECR